MSEIPKDEGLKGNETIEEAIALFKEKKTNENYAYALTTIRNRMKAKGEFVIGVDSSSVAGVIKPQVLSTEDGKLWWAAFTSFDEELKGVKDGSRVMSTFLTDIGKLFDASMQESTIAGIILNPWGENLLLNKMILSVIIGE